MKFVIQRVKRASLSVNNQEISKIEKGLVVFIGIGKGDDDSQFDYFIKKIINLRIFEDENEKMNYSLLDIKGEILLVSQFTLYADTSHGNRPSFFEAEQPLLAKALYEEFSKRLSQQGIVVKNGVFGADMKINQLNDGPVTIIL